MRQASKSGLKKKAAAVAALLAILAIGVGGTFAWQDYRQHKSNELGGIKIKYEARLVEDFEEVPDWKVEDGDVKKEIRVTNLGQAAAGYGAVYVRLQLKEFMQIGDITYVETHKRYMIDTEGQFITFTSENAAKTAYPDHEVEGPPLRDFVTGASGWFIVTQDHDPNGQMGKHIITNIIVGDATPVIPGSTLAVDKNHHGREVTDPVTGVKTFVTKSDECDYPVHIWDENLSTYRCAGIHEYIEWILGDDVILMSAWDGTPVAAWIIDDEADGDGWAYWGQPLATDGDTTSNLLEAVRLIEQPDGNFYYVIHTEMEALSIDEFFNGDGENWKTKVKDSYWDNRPRIEISGNATTVKEGETAAAPTTVTVLPVGGPNQSPIKWSSSNPALATVDENTGVVTGVKAGGPVTIIARTPGGARGQYTIMVTPGNPVIVPVTGVTLNKATLTLGPTGSEKLTATVNPANASNKAVTWMSSNPAVATVDASGNVTAVAPGTATITVKTAEGDFTATCAITVETGIPPQLPIIGDGSYEMVGNEDDRYSYSLSATILNYDFDNANIDRPGTIKFSDILPSSIGLGDVTVTADPAALNTKIEKGTDKDGDPAIRISYYGTKAQWDAAWPNYPVVTMTLLLNKPGFSETAITVKLAFEGSIYAA